MNNKDQLDIVSNNTLDDEDMSMEDDSGKGRFGFSSLLLLIGGGDKIRILDSGPEHLESGSLGL